MSVTSWVFVLVFVVFLLGLLYELYGDKLSDWIKPTKPKPEDFPPLHYNCRCEIPKVPDIPSISIPNIPNVPNIPRLPSLPMLPDFQTFSVQVEISPPSMEETQAMIEAWKRIAKVKRGRPIGTLRPPAGAHPRELWAAMRMLGAGYVELWAYAAIDLARDSGQKLEFELRGGNMLNASCIFGLPGGMSTNERK